jgi:hypothetical protein
MVVGLLAKQAERGGRGIALPILDRGIRKRNFNVI